MISPRYGFGYTLYMICIEGTKALAQSLASLILSSIIIYLTERRGIISGGNIYLSKRGDSDLTSILKHMSVRSEAPPSPIMTL